MRLHREGDEEEMPEEYDLANNLMVSVEAIDQEQLPALALVIDGFAVQAGMQVKRTPRKPSLDDSGRTGLM